MSGFFFRANSVSFGSRAAFRVLDNRFFSSKRRSFQENATERDLLRFARLTLRTAESHETFFGGSNERYEQ